LKKTSHHQSIEECILDVFASNRDGSLMPKNIVEQAQEMLSGSLSNERVERLVRTEIRKMIDSGKATVDINWRLHLTSRAK